MNDDDAWFVRRGSGWCHSLRPTGRKGAIFSGLYAATIILMAALVEKHPSQGLIWGVLMVCTTILYVVMAYRLSTPARPRN